MTRRRKFPGRPAPDPLDSLLRFPYHAAMTACTNIEIKARCADLDRVRATLESLGSDFRGADHQVDTYFRVPRGRLKLRQGRLENQLIFYERPDDLGPRRSDVRLFPCPDGDALRALLTVALGILVTVDKQREIHFLDNVKIHLDTLADLGTFVEIEAIDSDGTRSPAALLAQCEHYMNLFGISPPDLVPQSYSDLLLPKPS